MENRTNTAVIEITDTSVKFAVGYCINKKPVVVFVKKEPLPEGAVSQGKIVNREAVMEVVNKFHNIDDESVRRKVNDLTTVVIPPFGYKHKSSKRGTLGSRQDYIICPQDLSNIVNQAFKLPIEDGSALVDVIPTKVRVDGKEIPFENLYEVKGKELTAELSVHTVSESTLNEHKLTLQECNFRTDKASVAPYCAASLIASDNDSPTNYFYADFGARLTSFTLVARKTIPYENLVFGSKGGDDLTTYIANNLLLEPYEAEKLKLKFGYSDASYSFQLPIWRGVNLRGEQVKITQDDLNRVIVAFFDELNQYLANCIKTIRDKHPNANPNNLVLYVSGGATKLRGFDKLIAPLKNILKDVILYTPAVPGARDPELINLLGLIVINGERQEHTDGSFRGMSTLVRQ